MQRRSESFSAVSGAMLGAAAMIAYQVGGKATRDTLFLTRFAVTSLPLMFIGSALFSLALASGKQRRSKSSPPGNNLRRLLR